MNTKSMVFTILRGSLPYEDDCITFANAKASMVQKLWMIRYFLAARVAWDVGGPAKHLLYYIRCLFLFCMYWLLFAQSCARKRGNCSVSLIPKKKAKKVQQKEKEQVERIRFLLSFSQRWEPPEQAGTTWKWNGAQDLGFRLWPWTPI